MTLWNTGCRWLVLRSSVLVTGKGDFERKWLSSVGLPDTCLVRTKQGRCVLLRGCRSFDTQHEMSSGCWSSTVCHGMTQFPSGIWYIWEASIVPCLWEEDRSSNLTWSTLRIICLLLLLLSLRLYFTVVNWLGFIYLHYPAYSFGKGWQQCFLLLSSPSVWLA